MKILFIENQHHDDTGNLVFTGGSIYEKMLADAIATQNQVVSLKTETQKYKNISLFVLPFRVRRDTKDFKNKIKQLFKDNNGFDIVIMPEFANRFASGAQKWLKKRKVKIVGVFHHCSWIGSHGLKHFLLKYAEMKYLKRCNVVVFACPPVFAVSGFLPETKRTKKLLISVPTERIAVLPKVSKSPTRMCYVGRIQEAKGITELVRACAILKQSGQDFDLQLIGNDAFDPPYTAEIKKFIHENNLQNNITFCGGLPNAEKNKILASSQFFVFPSHLEGYGMVIPEAMQFGLPVIAWDIFPMSFSVQNEQNGLLVKHNDIQGFANAIKRLFNDGELLKTLSIGAKKSFEQTPSEKDFKRMALDFVNNLSGGQK